MSGTTNYCAIVTNPTGFENLVTISLLVFSTLSQYENVTVTASCGPGIADDATTIITIVNSNLKADKSISFEIPNYLKKPLDIIGLGDKTELSFGTSFTNFKECCGFGMAESTDGSFTCNLSVDAGPFTIFGIPLPPRLKKYVAADALNITLSGGGSVGIDGSYKACENIASWEGGGDLTVGVKLGGEITAKIAVVIILKAEIKGSTSITEKLSIEDLTKLKITTNWGGLTGEASGTIKSKNGKWDFVAKKTYFEQDNFLPGTIPLPF